MIASWRKSQALPKEERISFTMANSAVGITVTSLTDALSFVIGAISPVPAVRIFCFYTAVSVVFSYIYQITFFVGILQLNGLREAKKLHCHGPWQVMLPKEAKDKSRMALIFQSARVGDDPKAMEGVRECRYLVSFMEHYYTKILFHPLMLSLLTIWYSLYLAAALYGCTLLKEGLQLTKMLPQDGVVNSWYLNTQEYMWPYGEACVVYVLNSPDLTLLENRKRVEKFVSDFASSEHTIGPKGLLLWMHYYTKYLRDIGYSDAEIENDELWKGRLCFWLKQGRGKDAFDRHVQWAGSDFGRNHTSGCGSIRSFRFVVGLKRYVTPNDHRDTAQFMRETAASEPDFKAYAYNYYFQFADQYAIIRPNTIQNVLIALAVMVVVAALFIPNLLCAFIIAIAILSIDIGVIGTMYFWDINLDAVSMITIIMSIGFSVDLSAHICHAFVSAEGRAKERITLALMNVGVPVLQGALSSILGVSMLAMIENYMVKVFYKIVMLNMVYGLVHALMILPVVLVYTTELVERCRRMRTIKPGSPSDEQSSSSSGSTELQ